MHSEPVWVALRSERVVNTQLLPVDFFTVCMLYVFHVLKIFDTSNKILSSEYLSHPASQCWLTEIVSVTAMSIVVIRNGCLHCPCEL